MQKLWVVLFIIQLFKTFPSRPECTLCTRYRNFEVQLQPAVIEQCPCVKPPGSNECLAYDSRFQAASIVEALHTFPDLSNMSEKAQPLVSDDDDIMEHVSFKSPLALSGSVLGRKTYKTPKTYKCDTDVCRVCKLLITNAFIQASGIDFSTESTEEISSDIDETICFKNRPTRKSPSVAINNTTLKKLPPYLEEVVNLLKTKVRKRSTQKEPQNNLLGVATTIGCNYKKGEEIAHGWTGLCSLCWQWRKLPANYFPVLLNEIACDNNDEGCLAGFGNCRPVIRSINVLRNVATRKSPSWVQESINTISACECQVELGTPLHSLALR